MVLAIVCGALSGFVGFLPLILGLRMTRKFVASGNFGQMGMLLLCLIISFILMFVFAVICIMIDRGLALPFVLAEAVALCVSAIGFGIKKHLENKDER